MSYILDALKRADAERERGHVPGLHSQSGIPPAAPGGPSRLRPGAALVGGVVALLLLGAATWWWLTAPGAETPPPPTPVAQPPQPTPAPAPAPVPVPVPVLVPVPAAPIAMAPPAPALPILAPEPTVSPRVAPAPASASSSPSKTTPTVASPAETAAPANGAGNGSNVRAFAELAPEIRAQLPQVSVSGSTYSSNPAHRMLITNGKVVHEGEEIAPGLQLETIGPGKAVLNHRGTRYSIGY